MHSIKLFVTLASLVLHRMVALNLRGALTNDESAQTQHMRYIEAAKSQRIFRTGSESVDIGDGGDSSEIQVEEGERVIERTSSLTPFTHASIGITTDIQHSPSTPAVALKTLDIKSSNILSMKTEIVAHVIEESSSESDGTIESNSERSSSDDDDDDGDGNITYSRSSTTRSLGKQGGSGSKSKKSSKSKMVKRLNNMEEKKMRLEKAGSRRSAR